MQLYVLYVNLTLNIFKRQVYVLFSPNQKKFGNLCHETLSDTSFFYIAILALLKVKFCVFGSNNNNVCSG